MTTMPCTPRRPRAGAEVGAKLRLTLMRQGHKIDVRVTVEERQPDA